MKNTLILIGSFVLILAAVICTFGAVISAFSFTVDAVLLFVIWFLVALALSFVAMKWRGKGMLVLALPVLTLFSWKLEDVIGGAKWAAFFISREFNKWLVLPVLFIGATESAYELTLFFAAAGTFLAFLLTAAICLRRSAFLTVFITVPIVFVTFILIHSQPNYWFLIGLLAVYLTLLISNSLHGDDFQKRGKAIFPALALALVFLGITYLVAPPEGYKRELRMESIDFQLRNVASRIGLTQVKFGIGWPATASDEWRFNTETVEISNAGTRVITDRTILEVTASDPGTFYLRGFAMRDFDGEQWTTSAIAAANTDEPAVLSVPYLFAGEYLLTPEYSYDAPIDIKFVDMTVDKIRDATDNVSYRPYYSSFYSYDTQLSDDFVYTEESILKIVRKMRSSTTISPSTHYLDFGAEILARYKRQSREAYMQVDSFTAEGLRRLAVEAGIDAGADREIVVDQVAQYIRSSGRYTLTPYVIPKNEDFALYFLQESKQGYCIHFATAATLMLRALDIPARFTSGFTVSVPPESAGKPFKVTDRNAHAWVEVYYDEAGWLPLEVTPAAAGSGIPGARPHSPDDSSEPERNDDAQGGAEDRDRPDRPSTETEDGQEKEEETVDSPADPEQLKIIWDIVVIVVIVCAAIGAAALVLHRPIARAFRKKRFEQEDTNAAVICAWRYMARLGGKNELPKEIEELALKARFSQHNISSQERAEMISQASAQATEAYRKSKPFGKFWLYIRGL